MISIIDVLGRYWRNYKLYDDDSLMTGGLSRAEETLGDFLSDTDMDQYSQVGLLQQELKLCGLRQIDEIDMYIGRIIEKRINEIEEELGVQIDYNWDFEGFINGNVQEIKRN